MNRQNKFDSKVFVQWDLAVFKKYAFWSGGKVSYNRAYSSSLLSVIIAHSHLPFLKIFSSFVHFCPNFQIFYPFSEKSHASPYFLE